MSTYSYTYCTINQLFPQNNSKCEDCNATFLNVFTTFQENLKNKTTTFIDLFSSHTKNHHQTTTQTTRDLNTTSDKIKRLYQTHLSCYHFLFSSSTNPSFLYIFYLISWIIRRDQSYKTINIYIMYTALYECMETRKLNKPISFLPTAVTVKSTTNNNTL